MQALQNGSPVVSGLGGVQALERRSLELVRDLQTRRPAVYWTDFLLTSLLGWTSFALAVQYPLFSVPMACTALVATFALYRALLFVHEISHFTRGGLRGFETAWNLLAGFPLLLPSFVYCGMHQDHHRISLYGTERDPEYMPFGHSRGMATCFAVESFLIPLLLAIRFLLLAPLGLLSPGLHRWLAVHASSLVINFKYVRSVDSALERKMRHSESAVLLLWTAAAVAASRHLLPWRTFVVWLIIVSLASFINTVRTLVAHSYRSDGRPMDRSAQLIDSIDHPGGWWTELWAPVGLRYHALHHYFPGVPYHNLGKAYRRLVTELPASCDFRRSTHRSLPHSLRKLFSSAGR